MVSSHAYVTRAYTRYLILVICARTEFYTHSGAACAHRYGVTCERVVRVSHIACCRNPPPTSNVKAQPYKAIPTRVARPDVNAEAVRQAVRRFKDKRKQRGRPSGSNKTTQAEDKVMVATFLRVRRPLGKLFEAKDVWRALPRQFRTNVIIPSRACR